MAHYAVDERHALAQTLRSADPNSETLCGDWSVAQLTAHLVLRERSVIENLGRLPNARLQRRAEREINDLVVAQPFPQLVDTFEAGPSWRDAQLPVPVSLIWAIPAVRERANLLEYLVHHEDVRRAGAGAAPRKLPDQVQDAVWARLPALTRLTMRSMAIGVALQAPGRGEVRTGPARRGTAAVQISGEPVELALFAFGRNRVADLDYRGSEADVAKVRGTQLGI